MGNVTITKTKISTTTKVLIGVALLAGAAALANSFVKFKAPSDNIKTGFVRGTATTLTVSSAMIPRISPLLNGSLVISRFTFKAGAAHDAAIKKMAMRFNYSSPSIMITFASPRLLVVGSGAEIPTSFTLETAGTTNCGFTATTTSECLRMVFPSELTIPAGSSRTYELLMNVTGVTDGSTIVASLLADSRKAYGKLSGTGSGFDGGINGTPYNFMWSDTSALPHSTTSSDWFNGAYVTGLPISTTFIKGPMTALTVSPVAFPMTTLSNGVIPISRFNITAGAAHDASVEKISMRLDLTPAMTVISPSVREVGAGIDLPISSMLEKAGETDCGFTATATKVCLRLSFNNEQIVTKATSKTYEVRLNVSGVKTGSVLNSTLLGDMAKSYGVLSNSGFDAYILGSSYNNFIWSDMSSIPHTISPSSNDWYNGAYVKGLPTASQTFSY